MESALLLKSHPALCRQCCKHSVHAKCVVVEAELVFFVYIQKYPASSFSFKLVCVHVCVHEASGVQAFRAHMKHCNS